MFWRLRSNWIRCMAWLWETLHSTVHDDCWQVSIQLGNSSHFYRPAPAAEAAKGLVVGAPYADVQEPATAGGANGALPCPPYGPVAQQAEPPSECLLANEHKRLQSANALQRSPITPTPPQPARRRAAATCPAWTACRWSWRASRPRRPPLVSSRVGADSPAARDAIIHETAFGRQAWRRRGQPAVGAVERGAVGRRSVVGQLARRALGRRGRRGLNTHCLARPACLAQSSTRIFLVPPAPRFTVLLEQSSILSHTWFNCRVR